jgi:ABC-type glycerol-3-phosphate transport system substrate-binding protein
MKNINVVQAVLIGISGIAIIGAVIMFAVNTARGPVSTNGVVVMWGTLSQNSFSSVLQGLENDGNKIDGLKYVEKDPTTLNDELLDAIVEGSAPDLVLLDEKQIITNQKRMKTIPFTSFPLRDYQDRFIDESSLYITDEGIIGFPFLVDPVVMFYNKNILANAGYSKPPQTWTEVLAIAPTLTQKDSSFNISKSTIALGSFDNVTNSKNIFWTLVLQAGNPVIDRGRDPNTGSQVYDVCCD